MNELFDSVYIRELLDRHGFHFSKSMGQNFLINPTVCPRMAQACGAEDCAGVIEIGPGVGVLTRELSKVAEKVVAIELDRRLFPVLEETLADCKNVEIVEGDVLKLDLYKLIEEKFGGEKVCVCANLPYYITSPVIMRLIEEDVPLTSVTVMVQKEAAERFCAHPGTRECGAVSAAVMYYSEPKILFEVGRNSFMPRPNVDSAVIRLNIRTQPPVDVDDEELFFSIIKWAFLQRRKTASNSIGSAGRFTKQQVEAALDELHIDRAVRAEKLTLEQLAALSNILGR